MIGVSLSGSLVLNPLPMHCPGADPEIKEGWDEGGVGGHTYIEGGVGAVRVVLCFLCVCSTRHFWGGWGHAPPWKFRPYLSASEAVGNHQNYTKFMATQVIHHMVVSRNPFPSESAFVYEALPQKCLLGAADLTAVCLQNMKQWFT